MKIFVHIMKIGIQYWHNNNNNYYYFNKLLTLTAEIKIYF